MSFDTLSAIAILVVSLGNFLSWFFMNKRMNAVEKAISKLEKRR